MAFNLVRYSQQDPQWKNNTIGGGPDTIGYIGCALTCVAMYSSGWGFTETPGTLNKKLTANGGYVDEAIVWGAISKFYPQIKSTGLTICKTNTDAPISQIDASVAAGQPVIVEVDFSPAAGLQTHWVVLYAKQGNDYLMLDPWPYPTDTQAVTLMSRFSHGQTLARSIKAIAWYQFSASGSAPVPPSSTGGSTPTTPLPTPIVTDLVIQVIPTATAGIKLHTQASQDSNANYAELPGVPLNVIEAKTGALTKIGQNNQWIYVQDPQGHQGYVAAWLVQNAGTTPSTPSTPTPTPQPAPTPPSTPTTPSGPVVTDLVIQVIPTATAGIKLHTQASQDSTANYAEMPGVPLNVIEAKAGAQAKIGQNNQWISVQDPQGHQGYVSASLVQQSAATTPSTPTPQPAPTTTPDPTPEAPPPSGEPQRIQVVVVNVGSSGLNVRQQPSPGGSIVNTEKLGAKLTVIEPASTATPKIGVAGQWVAVKATNNQRGYVMSQYIKLIQ